MVVDMINQGVNRTTTVNNNVTSKPKTDEKKPVSKAVIGAGLIGLAALASVGIYLATRGKVKGKVNPKNLTDNNSVKKFENIINEFKTKNSGFDNIEPTITTLKNGKTKIEFKRFNRDMNCAENHMLVMNKDGEFDKMIRFNTFNDPFNDVALKQYFVTDGIGRNAKTLKVFNSSRSKGVEEGFNIEQHKISVKRRAENQPDGTYWKQNTETSKSDNYIHVEKGMEVIPFKESRGHDIKTTAHLGSDKKPDLVQQSVLPRTADEEKRVFVYKPGKAPIKTENKKNPFVNIKDFANPDEAMKHESFVVQNANV